MKKSILSLTALMTAASVFASPDLGEQVLMTVDGRDVKVSEFLYLFNKNNSQQITPQSVDDYVGLFVDYKLKVVDAYAAGIDTTAAFVAEFDKYRDELAAPYLRDESVEKALLKEAYSHMANDVNVSHIMIPVNRSVGVDTKAYTKMDSIRAAIADGRITFEDAAAKYSVDAPTAKNGGLMGWIAAGRFPWAFEKAAYDTPAGSISPVIDSGFGLHIVKTNDVRPSRGEVHAAHILRMTRGMSDVKKTAEKHTIDSIYTLLANGADFAQLAQSQSQDPGSAQKGGDLGWFGGGVMVAEFDSVAFALADGEISVPFETAFGYHIIKRYEHRGVESMEEAKQKLMSAMARDGRINEPHKAMMRKLAEKYNVLPFKANEMALKHRISMLPPDSALMATLAVDVMPLVRIGEGEVSVADAFAALTSYSYPTGAALASALIESAGELSDKYITQRAIADLAVDNVDYRNLVNEYRDGILLFEISNRTVWDKASQDKDGLEKYFKNNVSRYAWDAPRFKSYIIFASNDSTVNEAVKYADTLDKTNPEAFVAEMRNHFGKDVKIERIIAAKGENAITDYLAFGGDKPEAKSPKWSSYAAYNGRLIEQPEESADVRGAATADYQAQLEKEWLKKLHKKYKTKINKKVLKDIKAETLSGK